MDCNIVKNLVLCANGGLDRLRTSWTLDCQHEPRPCLAAERSPATSLFSRDGQIHLETLKSVFFHFDKNILKCKEMYF